MAEKMAEEMAAKMMAEMAEKTRVMAYAELIDDGTITIEHAATKLRMSVEELQTIL